MCNIFSGFVQESDNVYLKKYLKKWWRDAESNCGHIDFQSTALPTELSRHQIKEDADSLTFGSVRLFESRKHGSAMFPLTGSIINNVKLILTGGADGIRTRDLMRDRHVS